MKKALLMLLFIAGSYVVFGQEEGTYSKDTSVQDMNNTHKTKIKHKHDKNVEKQTMENAVITSDSLSVSKTGTFALLVPPVDYVATMPYLGFPVLQTQVPVTVVETFKNKYGTSLYDITAYKNLEGKAVYIVRVYDKGQYRTDYLDESGNIIVPAPFIK
jgi:hypothetical protein